jgi:hypothetical protein
LICLGILQQTSQPTWLPVYLKIDHSRSLKPMTSCAGPWTSRLTKTGIAGGLFLQRKRNGNHKLQPSPAHQERVRDWTISLN